MKNLTLVLLLVSFSSFGQLKQKIADQHYARLEYSKCVEMYNELAEKVFKGKSKSDWKNVERAAISNYQIFNMSKAIMYFEKLHGANKLTEKQREMYVEALRYESKYGKSNEVVREGANLFPNNAYFKHLLENKDKFDQLFADSAFYRIRIADINSGDGDFGAAYYGNSITYVTKSKNTGFANTNYGWDDAYYLNIMQSNFGEDSVLQSPQLLKHEFISRAHDGPVSFHPNGTEMIITKNELGKKNGKEIVHLALYFSKFENGEWGDLTPFEFNSTSYDVGHGVYADNGNTIYFVMNKPGGVGESDIYKSTRMGTGWSEPVILGSNINTTNKEMFPFVQDNILYFASDGHFGLGGLDIFQVDLASEDKPYNIGYPVNTSHDDFGLIFDNSGKIGYLSSNRDNYVDNIYHVVRRLLDINLEGDVYEKYAELELVPNQEVLIKNTTTQDMITVTTNENGRFETPLKINNKYKVYTKKEDYILLGEVDLSTEGIRKDSTFYCELVLKPTTILVHLRVIEKKSGKIIPDATVTVRDYDIDWDTTLITNAEGMVTLDVERNKVYWAHGSKRGYIDTDVSFNSQNETDRVIDVELALPLIKKGERFKLENIFYDLNKSTLRPESKSSLDKLAEFIINNNLTIELSAHTDSRGSSSYNQRLSQARAQSCVDYLISKGVRKNSIKAKGYGETQLVNRCKNGVQCSEEEHQENRRTEVKILEVR